VLRPRGRGDGAEQGEVAEQAKPAHVQHSVHLLNQRTKSNFFFLIPLATVDDMARRFRSPALLALALTVLLWASAFPAIRVGLAGLGVGGLSLLRLAIASAALAVLAPILKVRRPAARDLPLIGLCGASGMSAYQLLLNRGVVLVPAGTASLLVAMAPVFSVLLAAAFLGERLRPRTVLGSAIAIAGAAMISIASGTTGVSLSALVVLAAALMQGVYHFASKPLLARYTGMEVACYTIWTGTALLLPFAPDAIDRLAHAPGSAIGAAVYLGLLPSALGFVGWGYAVARFTVATSTAALYLVPPVTLVVAFVWLGEIPRPVELLGGLISIAGVVLINSRRPKPAPVMPEVSRT
jgi:drug/metabolite transporter (DMT)-like permease